MNKWVTYLEMWNLVPQKLHHLSAVAKCSQMSDFPFPKKHL